MNFKFTVAVCVLLVAGCAPQAEVPTPVSEVGTSPLSAVQEADFSTLAGEWVVSSLQSGSVEAGSSITMSLKTTGEFAGSAGCNRYFGKFVWAEGRLGSGPVGSTMMACEESRMAQEHRYLGLLPKVTQVSRADGRLQLLDNQDRVLVEMLLAEAAGSL